MKITRRKFITTSLVAGTGIGLMGYFESGHFEVTEKSIKLNRMSNPLKLLHLSDFHASKIRSLKSI